MKLTVKLMNAAGIVSWKSTEPVVLSTAKALLIFSLLLWCAQTAFTQQIKGMVLEQDETGKLSPIEGVNVYWLGTTLGTSTDSLGFFSIEVASESRRLVFSYVGYKADTLYARLSESLQVVLKQTKELSEVNIVYRAKATEISSLDVQKIQIMSEKELFKAACCNLSESFETNPSIDVNLTDAITGTRQIQMLGLGSPYLLISQENIPALRGLASIQGFGFIPGTWMESIQVSKGTGSVVNGFESMTGQMNLEYQKPEKGDLLYLNGYLNESGRAEANLVSSQKLAKNWGNTLFLHRSTRRLDVDQNGDQFLDLPKGDQFSLMNRLSYSNPITGLESQIGFKFLSDAKHFGNIGVNPRTNRAGLFDANQGTQRLEAWAKVGYVFPQSRYKSIGLQTQVINHNQSGTFESRTLKGTQRSFYSNLIYQTIIGNTDHTLRTGVSFQSDLVYEQVEILEFWRRENVPGVFSEYQYAFSPKASLIAGMRADHHSMFGWFFTPRLHGRWELLPKTVLRWSAGQGRRSASLIAENEGLLATSRVWRFFPEQSGGILGFRQELSTNLGLSLTRNFRLDYRDGYLSAEFFHTRFERQVVVDIDASSREVQFYALEGASFANAFQIEGEYELFKRFDLRLAYRRYQVETDFRQGRLERALIARHRAFMNLAYETRGSKWMVDLTIQYIGSKRLPQTRDKAPGLSRPDRSPGYLMVNTQITRSLGKRWQVYLGIENLNNFVQKDPIISADAPFSPDFDSSIVWAPIFGRMYYTGFRYRIKKDLSRKK